MGRFSNIKRIIREDFPEEDQETVDKIGYVVNDALEQLTSLFNKNITVNDNLNERIQDITVKVDSTGAPLTITEFSYSLIGNCKGISVINAINKTDVTITPTSQPFMTFTQNVKSLIRIVKVTGLQPNNEYQLTIRVTGSG